MKKPIIVTFIGLICGAVGVFITYLFLASIDDGINLIFMALSPVLISVSVFCFFLATKQKKTDIKIIQSVIDENTANIIQNNNDKFDQWEKSNSQRDKLKILKMSGELEDSK